MWGLGYITAQFTKSDQDGILQMLMAGSTVAAGAFLVTSLAPALLTGAAVAALGCTAVTVVSYNTEEEKEDYPQWAS
jgi:hypothetical protein